MRSTSPSRAGGRSTSCPSAAPRSARPGLPGPGRSGPTPSRSRPAPDQPPRPTERGVVALEFALALPLVALLVVGVLSLVGVVHTSLVVQEAARVGARLAAVHPGDGPVVRAVATVAGPDVEVEVGPRRVGEVVTVDVRLAHRVLGVDRSVTGRAAAMVEPVTRS